MFSNFYSSLLNQLDTKKHSLLNVLMLLFCVAVLFFSSSSFSRVFAASNSVSFSEPLLSPCHIKGLADQIFCGKISRPENPEQSDGATIDVHYAVLPALRDSYPGEALLVVAGGPGQSAMDYAAYFDRLLQDVRRERDILIIDQRGTGRSQLLQCDDVSSVDPLAYDDSDVDVLAETEACYQSLSRDLNFYTSRVALDDFEAIRKRLSYQSLHLFGISYGTRMVQLYMRHYPNSVLSAVMDGVVPLRQNVLAVGESVDQAFDLLFQQCEAQEACHKRYPDLQQDFEALQISLQGQSLIQGVKHPQSGAGSTLRLSQAKLNGVLRMALYSPQARVLIPYAIDRLKLGDAAPLLGLMSLSLEGLDLAMGMHAAIVCAEDWPRLSDEERETFQESLIGADMIKALDASCPIWKLRPQLEDFTEALKTDIPVLMLSGRFDPATPPQWAEAAQQTLSNSRHLLFPYATHSVAGQSCAPEIMAEFFSTQNPELLDISCMKLDAERGFYLNANSAEVILKEKALD